MPGSPCPISTDGILLRCGRDDLKARASTIMFSGARHIAKLGATAILASSPMLGARLGRIERAGALTILNFHRVDDRHVSSYGAIAPRYFDELVGWLKSRFRIVTFRDLRELAPHGKPPLILSFDDGYRDFVDVVAPI